MIDRTCQQCGEPMTRMPKLGPQPKYCSESCRTRSWSAKKIVAQRIRLAAARAAKTANRKPCPQCGGPVERQPGKRGPVPMYCSALCKGRAASARRVADGRYAAELAASAARSAAARAANARPCQYCGAPMADPRRKQCGSPGCERRFNADRSREYFRRLGGNPYVKPEHGRTANAALAAKRAARQAAGLPANPWTEPRKAADQRRRAAKRGAATEKFTPLEIFERDRWKCGICGRKVDRDLAYPDPKSASLDHIVPLSCGGEHSRANSRLAHLDCNIQRGNRGGNEQLSLVG
jgi:5-methylcytosine-specific restriction endonuclease McrA